MSASDVWLFLQQGILSGMVTGSVYALLAIAVVIIFKTTDVPNFSQGEIFMAAGYVGLILLVLLQWPYFAVIPTTLVVVAVAAALFQRVVLKRAAASRAIGVQLVIATLGFAYLLKGLVRRTGLGDTPRSLPAMVPTDSISIGDASLTLLDIAIFGTSVLFMGLLFAMFAYTRVGRAMRAAGMNPRAAQLVGVNLSRIHMMIWALSGLVSAVAALLIAPKLLITPEIAHVAILAYAAAIVGGFTSLPGAVLGGFIIGIAENLVGLFISTNAIVVAPFVAIMLVLIVRPQGILGGKQQVKKV
jgi:branched-chain amino acid transport system permease protein